MIQNKSGDGVGWMDNKLINRPTQLAVNQSV